MHWRSSHCVSAAATEVDEVVEIMRMNIEKVLQRDERLCELDDRADALQSSDTKFAAPRSGLTHSFGAKLSEATNWVSSLFKRKRTWEWDVFFCTIIFFSEFSFPYFPSKHETEMAFNF